MDKKLKVLITGVGSGIGKAVCEYFLQKDCAVFGIDIKKAPEREGLVSFVADITDETCLLTVKAELENEGVTLDAIINIAGMHLMASLVESSYADMERLIRVNLCGTMLVNRTFHSLLGKGGRVVIVTSEVAGFDPMPFNGLYSVSKTALECYAQALRQELNLLGQKVVTVRPGAVKTELLGGSLTATERLAEETVLYKKQAKHFLSITKKFMGTPISADALAKTVYKATVKKHPKFVYNKHRNAGLVLLNMLPRSWQCGIIKRILNRK